VCLHCLHSALPWMSRFRKPSTLDIQTRIPFALAQYTSKDVDYYEDAAQPSSGRLQGSYNCGDLRLQEGGVFALFALRSTMDVPIQKTLDFGYSVANLSYPIRSSTIYQQRCRLL
jgi:hypothetical protein